MHLTLAMILGFSLFVFMGLMVEGIDPVDAAVRIISAPFDGMVRVIRAWRNKA